MQRQQRTCPGDAGLSMLLACAVLAIASPVRAQEQPADAVPGSPRPTGLSLSPEAPPVPPAPGGRAPSFGAPAEHEQAQFRFGGRIYAWEAIGIGRTPRYGAEPDPGLRLHVPALTQGRQPFWPQTGTSLFFSYGTPTITATVTVHARAPGRELQGYAKPTEGISFGQAFLTVNPQPLGKLRLSFRVGGFTENFAGPGQWGWGIFGPMLAVRGYGATAIGDYDATPELRLNFEYGVMGVPGVPEEFARGNYTGWTETGLSTLVQHAHAGFSYQNKYVFKLHYARATGTDERRYLVQDPSDGSLDAYIAEARYTAVPFGQVGVSGAFWNLSNATAVHDGIWWGIDWTKGAQDMIMKYVGGASDGNGQVAAISAQYDMSLAQLLYHYAGRSFDGNAPDVRVALAGVYHQTVASDDPNFDDANGYLLGADLHYQMLRWFGVTLRSYGESRDAIISTEFDQISGVTAQTGRWSVYSISPGLAFRSNWQSTDRIELIYSRRFYSDTADNNAAAPLDRDVFALGAYIDF
jgi:hypothetical protein